MKKRMITGKNQKMTLAEREEKRLDLNVIRDMNERKLLGGYELIFPLDEIRANEARSEEYQRYLDAA